MENREEWLAGTLVELADTLVDDFDLGEFLSLLAKRCVELFGAVEAGLMLADPKGNLRFMASSSERSKSLEVFELQNEEGPCLDCFRTGEQVVNQRLGNPPERWPRFSAEAEAAGFVSAHALPLRVRGKVIGAINLFHATDRRLDSTDVMLAQAMADIATIGILQARTINEASVLAEQLTRALDSRIVLEQAKGRLAERQGLDVDQAFSLLRGYSRGHNRRLTEVTAAFLSGELSADELNPDRRRRAGTQAWTTRGAAVRSEPHGDPLGPEEGPHPPEAGAAVEPFELARGLLRVAAIAANEDVLDAALRLVVALARVTVTGADGVSVSLSRRGALVTVAASDETIRGMDADQYATGEGPCVAAATAGRWFHVESLDDEPRWPAFIPRARERGINSILSTPLFTHTRPMGAMNIYSRRERAFAAPDLELSSLFAAQASDLLVSAAVDVPVEDLNEQLQDALRGRDAISQARGILMERHGVSPDSAYTRLRRSSHDSNRPLRELAEEIMASTQRVPGADPAG